MTTATRIDPRSLRAATMTDADTMTATPPSNASRRLPLAVIRLDGGTQPRAALDQKHISDLTDDLRAGALLPPVDVMYDGENYWLFDGFHRWHAHKAIGGEGSAIEARIHQGDQTAAQWASFAVNKSHGLRRTTEDKQRAIDAALKHPNGASRSNREIARHLGVDDKTVGDRRKRLESAAEIPQLMQRTGADGKTYDTTNIGARREAYTSGLPTLDLPETVGASVVASDAARTRQNGAPLGKCRVCNRPLTDPAQAAQGIGACCAAKQAAALTVDGDRPLPGWVTDDADTFTADDWQTMKPAPPLDRRVAQASRLINVYRQTIASFDEYGELTGRHVETLPAKREMEKLIARLEAEIGMLEGRPVEEVAA